MNTKVFNALTKLAYVPLSPAAQEAMAAPQGGAPMTDPAMMQQEGAPMPPQGAGMPQPPPQIQTVPGPNGEPIDPETGFIVVDPAQGIELEPLTGLLFSKFTMEFATQDGQMVPVEQAQAMIAQAMQQGGGMPGAAPQGGAPMPPQGGGMPDPAMLQQGGAPMPPQGAGPVDPAVAQMAGGGPMIDPQTGLPIDPQTGMIIDPQQMTSMPGGVEEGLEAAMPGIEKFINKVDGALQSQDKINKRMLQEIAGTRTDLQAHTRELQQLNDNQDTQLARLENILNLIESRLSGGATAR